MKHQRGFTLLELMVAVAMIAIVATIAFPSWQEFVANRRTAGASRDIYNALQHTRMKAIKEGQTITVTYYDDEGKEVAGASDSARKEFQTASMSWDEDGDGTKETTEIFKAPDNVNCNTNQDTTAYNSRGILLATNSGTLRAWSALTLREYSVVINNLGTLRQASGTHGASDPGSGPGAGGGPGA